MKAKREKTYDWRPDERANAETADHETNAQRYDNETHVEVSHQVVKVTGDDRRGKGNLDHRHGTDGSDVYVRIKISE